MVRPFVSLSSSQRGREVLHTGADDLNATTRVSWSMPNAPYFSPSDCLARVASVSVEQTLARLHLIVEKLHAKKVTGLSWEPFDPDTGFPWVEGIGCMEFVGAPERLDGFVVARGLE